MLVCVVVGSGIMGTELSDDAGVALIINAVSTIFALALLIQILGPLSGAHFNPVVTLVSAAQRELSLSRSLAFIAAQISGAISGSLLANAMFNLPLAQISGHDRVTQGTLIGEVLATAGLIIVIGTFVARKNDALIPIAVAAWIGSAYFFTSSTSFANPAVTIGRVFTDTFAGIAPGSVLPFIAAQVIGALIGLLAVRGITNAN
jgi:glycerol uptake facilitator-like aquaporin